MHDEQEDPTVTHPETSVHSPSAVGQARPPRLDRRLFRRDLTPTWLATSTLLAGQRPVDLSEPFRAAYLGIGSGFTAAVAAAVHPNAHIWAWDGNPASVEALRHLKDRASIENLTVHEQPYLPADLVGEPFDLVVVDGVLDACPDELRDEVVAAIGRSLRPGGVVCLTYRTVVGWGEIAPIQHLVRYMVGRDPRPQANAARDALRLLKQLRDGGARYITDRPMVAAWLEELLDTPPEVVVRDLVERDLRPISHAQVVASLTSTGCVYLDRPLANQGLKTEVPRSVQKSLPKFASSELRETFRDIASRPSERVDLFRLGEMPLSKRDHSRACGSLRLLMADDEATETVVVADLDSTPSKRAGVVRKLLDSGQADPVHEPTPGRSAIERGKRLSELIGRHPMPQANRYLVAPLLGSAITAASRPSRERRARLGML